MELPSTFKAAIDKATHGLATVEDIERSVQRRLFFMLSAFLAAIATGYALAYSMQGRWDGVVRTLPIALVAGAALVWGRRLRNPATALALLAGFVFVVMAWSTLRQGPGLPAAGWWLSIIPFILAGGGLHRLAVVAVLGFIGIVSYLYAAAHGLAPEPAPREVQEWQRYAAVIGSELLALVVIIVAAQRRVQVARALE